jgi:hypothetical protein
MLLVCFKFLPVCLSKALLLFTYAILSWVEKRFFLYYVHKDLNYPQTLQKIRNSLFCPHTVEKIYNFWIDNPGDASFKGITSERASDQAKTWAQTSENRWVWGQNATRVSADTRKTQRSWARQLRAGVASFYCAQRTYTARARGLALHTEPVTFLYASSDFRKNWVETFLTTEISIYFRQSKWVELREFSKWHLWRL